MTESHTSRRTFLKVSGTAALAAAGGSVLAACSSSSSPSPSSSSSKLAGTTINFWWWKNDPNEQVVNRLAAAFKQETGITVQIRDTIPYKNYFTSLVNAIAAGNAPDAAEVETVMQGQLIAANAVANLNDQINSWSGASDVVPTLWPTVENADGSGKYALPFNYLTFILIYRKDLLAEAGVTVPTTQEELVAASKKLASVRKGQYGFYIRGGFNGQDDWASFLVAGGAQIINKSGQVVLDSPQAQTANNLYISMNPTSPPGTTAVNSGLVQEQALEAGIATMIIDNIGGTNSLTKPELIDATIIPSATGSTDQPFMAAMNNTAVLSSSSKQEAAFKWISYLTEAKAQQAITNSTAGYLPVVTSVLNSPQYANNRFFQTSVAAGKHGAITWPALPGVTKVTEQVWEPLFQGALLGKNTNTAVITGVVAALQSS
jgi:multiple sugar transport system substrate-binding protein